MTLVRWCIVAALVGCGGDKALVADSDSAVETEAKTDSAIDTDADAEIEPEAVADTAIETTVDGVETEAETTPNSWALLVASYDRLETVAGRGTQRDKGNEWLASYEGGPAKSSELSRPHMAMADSQGRIFIADKEAHGIRRVDRDGTIHTVAGTNVAGDDGDTPGPATTKRLTDPNGLYVLGNDVVHILDQGNGKVRRLATDGTLTTLFAVPGGIDTGRGLWVAEDESAAFVASGEKLLRWQADVGVKVYAQGFVELGNLVVDPDGLLVATDRGGHRVYRVAPNGTKTAIAGNGTMTGGGDGAPALSFGLNEPRAVWFLPKDIGGGYLVGTHEGNQVWYVDPAGLLHLFLDGGDGHAHSGDGQYFRTPGQKVSEVRAITMAPNGDIVVTENDYGFIRRVLRRQAPAD